MCEQTYRIALLFALSGGIDSSAIAAELTEAGAAPNAFTVVFQNDTSDLPYASAVAGAVWFASRSHRSRNAASLRIK